MSDKENTVTIIASGASYSNPKFEGYTISQIRAEFGRQMGISDEASAKLKGGSQVEDDYSLSLGDTVKFFKPTGTKG